MTPPKRKTRAGHRSWAPRGGKIPGRNRGDIMSVEKRSELMRRIRGKNTTPERIVARSLRSLGLRFQRHVRGMPGSPDFVFSDQMVAVFIDGDFWHGWRFPLWEHKMTQFWRMKISANRARDRRNFAKLRQRGWKVVRIWEHQVEANAVRCVMRIQNALRAACTTALTSRSVHERSHA